MHNVAPTLALARRARQMLILAFFAGALGLFLSVLALSMFVIRLAIEGTAAGDLYNFVRTVLLVIGVGIVLVGVGLALRAITWKTDNSLAIKTGERLAPYLDERFTFVRNVSKFGLGYIDAVLVGPPGALVFRIVDKTGHYLNEHGNWLVRDKQGGWSPATMLNPTRDTTTDIDALRKFLAKRNLDAVPVFGVVVFTRSPNSVFVETRSPVVPVALLDNLLPVLQQQYLTQDRITAEQADAVVRKLYTPH